MKRNIIHEVKGLLPEPVVISLRDELFITEDIDSEVDTAAQCYGYYAVLAEKAQTVYEKAKFAFEAWQADKESEATKERSVGDDKPFTVAQMKAYIVSQPEYKIRQLRMIKRSEDFRVLKQVAKAFELKKDMVQTKSSNRRKESNR